MARDSQARETDREASLVDRRSYLKFLGLATAPAVASATTDSARAATATGFGEDGYGDGGYGGSSTESTLAVSTGTATDVTESRATLTGEVTDLGGASSVDVTIEIRRASATTWTATNSQTLSSTGAFSTSVTDLSSATDYQFRAVVAASDGDTATGSTRTFTTSSVAHSPDIGRFDLSESGSPNPHAEISIGWGVSDVDADLRTVELTVTDARGQSVKSTTNDVSGTSASGTESYKIKHGDGTTYDCTLTVTDSKSQTTSRTKTVSA